MKKRYINGIIFSSAKAIHTVEFKFNPDLSEKYRIEYDYTMHRVLIEYYRDCYSTDLGFMYEAEEVMEHVQITQEGIFDLLEGVTINNVEIVPKTPEVTHFAQYLVSDTKSKVTGSMISDHCLNVVIRESDLLNIESDYLSLFKNVSDHVFIRLLEDKPIIANVYFCPLRGQIFKTSDFQIYGKTPEYQMNDVKAMASLVDALTEAYPSVQVFTDEDDRNLDKYNEWMYIIFEPRSTRSQLFTNHANHIPSIGMYWHSTVDFSIEYASTDLAQLLGHRDAHSTGGFLNDVKLIECNAGTEENPDYVVNSLYWDRDIANQYQMQTQLDPTGFSVATLVFTGRLLYTNVQLETQELVLTEKVIFDIQDHNFQKEEVNKDKPKKKKSKPTGIIM